jgi:LmbE family N-acetylglucosaminyl deacetylase
MGKILVVSAHPDDEVLGVGGTMLRHIAAGDEVCWLIVTNIFEKQGFDKSLVEKRQKEIDLVAQTMKIEKVIKLDYPTMTLSSSSLLTLIPAISKIFIEFLPETIYCLNRSDAHSDHRIVFDAVMACTKSFRYPFIHKVLMYECISETEFAPALPEKAFIPNYFIDITPYIEKKLEIMKIYASELGSHPFPRSLNNISALATFRGSIAGVEYAEAFQLIKWIDK